MPIFGINRCSIHAETIKSGLEYLSKRDTRREIAHRVYRTFAVYRIFAAIDDIRRHPWPDKRKYPVYPYNHSSIYRLTRSRVVIERKQKPVLQFLCPINLQCNKNESIIFINIILSLFYDRRNERMEDR